MAEPDNPFFAQRAGQPLLEALLQPRLVDPEDDMRVTNPPTNPELLDALAKHFIESGFDLKELVRTICTSNDVSAQRRAERVQRRRQAELLALLPEAAERRGAARRDRPGDRGDDASSTACPRGRAPCSCRTRASNSYFLHRVRPAGWRQRLRVRAQQRGEPGAEPAPAEFAGRAEQADERQRPAPRQLAAEKNLDHPQKIEQTLSAGLRTPARCRSSWARPLAYIEKVKNDKQAYEDILWALINTKEFLFNH